MSVSLSKSALILSPCLRWAWDGAKEYDELNTDTSKRDKGTLFHSLMDAYHKTGAFYSTNGEVGDWAQDAITWSKEHLDPRLLTKYSEVYVGVNFATGEVHTDPDVCNRKYPKLPGFVPGTADIAAVMLDGSLLVADWKTGGATGADKQLLSLAYGLQRVYRASDGGLRPVSLAILYAGEASAPGIGVTPVEWTVTNEELDAHAQAMAFQLEDVGVRREPVPGIHCTQMYCPHLAFCPGITGIVETEAEGPKGLLPAHSLVRKYQMSDSVGSDEHAGYIMERVYAAKRQLTYYDTCVRRYINNGGKAISGDFEFKSTNSGFRWVKRGR